mmetsp:Transcript_21361/g.49286  ORF Transcript_21361/g.49286 Transcript_21361/m.49286 type:complete len:262 (-) Transcript_21361:684-1469(-)
MEVLLLKKKKNGYQSRKSLKSIHVCSFCSFWSLLSFSSFWHSWPHKSFPSFSLALSKWEPPTSYSVPISPCFASSLFWSRRAHHWNSYIRPWWMPTSQGAFCIPFWVLLDWNNPLPLDIVQSMIISVGPQPLPVSQPISFLVSESCTCSLVSVASVVANDVWRKHIKTKWDVTPKQNHRESPPTERRKHPELKRIIYGSPEVTSFECIPTISFVSECSLVCCVGDACVVVRGKTSCRAPFLPYALESGVYVFMLHLVLLQG